MKHYYRKTCVISFFLVFTFQSFKVFSQTGLSESCSKITFSTAFEQKGFEIFCNTNNPDYMHMAVAVDKVAGTKEFEVIKSLIDDEIALLKKELPSIKKNYKKIKYIFDHVHQTFLLHMDEEALFTDIFATGRYNGITASTLYSFILEALNQKYIIRFLPGHAYLVVYADNIPYAFESIDPVGGFFEITPFVQNQLAQNEREIQMNAANAMSSNKSNINLANYYFRLNGSDRNGLIASMYVRKMLKLFSGQQFLEAVYETEKANLFMPADELSAIITQFLGSALDLSEHCGRQRAIASVKYYNEAKISNKKKLFTDDFRSVLYECYLGSFPAPDSVQMIYEIMMKGIKDEDVRSVLTKDYNEIFAHYVTQKVSIDKRFPILYKMYCEATDKEDLTSILSREINFFTEGIGINNIALAQYDSLLALYPLFNDISIFKSNHCRFLINATADAFRLKDIANAEKLMLRFEAGYTPAEMKTLYTNPAEIYSLAASHYFKKGNTAKAKTLLNKGLTYAPDNWELKKKLSELK